LLLGRLGGCEGARGHVSITISVARIDCSNTQWEKHCGRCTQQAEKERQGNGSSLHDRISQGWLSGDAATAADSDLVTCDTVSERI
jgi:hypothetical protein